MSLDKNIIGREILTAIEASKSDYKTLAPIELWVDATTGDDANDGSEDAPLASIVEAERRLPIVIDHNVLIHVGPHTGAGYAPPTFRERVMRAFIDIVATSINVLTETTLYEGIAQSGTSTTVCVAVAGLVTDTYRGKTIVITSGAAFGYRRTISTNTDTNITPCLAWPTGTLAPGDTFKIVEPSTTIYVPVEPTTSTYARWRVTGGAVTPSLNSPEATVEQQYAVSFVNFRIDGGGTVTDCAFGATTRFFGCRSTKLLGLNGGCVDTGVDGALINSTSELAKIGTRVAGVDAKAWVGWGLHSSGNILITRQYSSYLFGIVAPGVSFFQCPSAHLRGACNIYTSGVTVYGDARSPGCVVLSGKSLLSDIPQRITRAAGSNAAVTVVGLGAICEIMRATITAGAGAGLYVHSGAKAHITESTTITATTGVRVKFGGRAQFVNSSLSITASGNQLEVGNTPTTSTVAALNAVGTYISEADGSVIQRVT